MRNKRLFASLVVIALFGLVSLASATDVTLTVSTYANHDVSANVVNPATEETVHSSIENSGEKGKAIFSFETSASKIDISIIVRKNGKIVVFKKLENQTPSSSISVTALKEEPEPETEPEPEVNETEEAEEEVAEVTTETEVSTASESIEENLNNETQEEIIAPFEGYPYLNIILYVVGGIILVFIIAGFVLFLIFRKRTKPKSIKVKKYSEMKKEANEKEKAPTTEEDKRLAELEEKINGLKEEIEGIRNKKKRIKDAEEKLRKDMEELEKLKKESQ